MAFFSESGRFGHGYFGVQNLSVGRPSASTSAPWGPFCQLGDNLGDHGSSRKDTCGSGTRLFVILKCFWEPIWKAFCVHVFVEFYVFFGLVSWPLFVLIFDSKVGRPGLPKPSFRKEGIAKINFSHKLEFR